MALSPLHAGAPPAATLRADYQFQNTLASSVGGAPPLANLGANFFASGVVDGTPWTLLDFAANDGLSLSPASSVLLGSYSIVILFEFDQVTGWRRILDYKNAASDTGLYSYGGDLNFYNVALGSGAPITAGEFVQVVLTRDASGSVAGYVNGAQQFGFMDTNALAVVGSGDILRLFRDEDPIVANEASAGSIARLRIYDGVLTPGEVAALDRLPVGPPPPSNVQFGASAYQSSEGIGMAVLTVTRSGVLTNSASVDLQVVGGTATPGADYFGTNGLVNFSPGQTTQTFNIPIVDDALVEGNETVNLALSNPVGATLGVPSTAELTIVDNDTNATPVDLAVTKTLVGTNTLPVNSVTPFNFQLTITNLGPNTVSNVTVTDLLPPGLSFSSSINGADSSYNPANGVWTIFPPLNPGQGSAMTLGARGTNVGTFTNIATINIPAGIVDPNPNNNSASAVVMVTPQTTQADLQITKTASTNNVQVGQQVMFKLDLKNLGPDYITNDIVTTDCLPPGFQYVTDSTVGGGGLNGIYNPGTCLWTVSGGLGTNFVVHLQITALATNAGVHTNMATVAVPPGITDSNTNNNSAQVAVTVTSVPADLAVTKTIVGTNTLPINSSTPPFNFRLTVTNLGPNTVSNVTLTDLLPPGLSFSSSINGPDSSYEPSNGVWSIALALSSGQGSAMTLAARGTNAGTFTNTLTLNVPVGVTDTNANNNSARAVVTVLPVYEVSGLVDNCRSNGLPLANVTVTLSGAANQVTTTIPGGSYKFYFVSNGNYTITPSQPGNVFVPPNVAITVNNANVTAPTLVGSVGLIYGGVFYFGSPVTNHPVKLTGAQMRSVPTDANGYYTFTNTPVGNYTVTAVATNGYVFTPTNAAITLNATNCAGLANFFAQNRRGVQLVALEVVQVIQDWSNSVRLIQDKETYVRAHLQLTNNNPVLLQGARLYGTGAGAPLAGSPLSPIPPGTLSVKTTNAATGRGQLTNSLNFRLPANWLSATISLQFVCTNNVTVLPTNTVPANSTVQVTFIPTAPLPVRVYPVHWTNAAGVFQQISNNNLADVPRRLLSMYPVPSIDARPAPAMIMTNTTPPPYTVINSRLNASRALDLLVGLFLGSPTNRIYHGAVAGATIAGWGRPDSGLAVGAPSFVSSGLMPPNDDFYGQLFLRHLATHEVGHNLGRPHTTSAALFGTLAGGRPRGGCGEWDPAGTPAFALYQTVTGLYTNKPALGPMNSGTNSLIYGLDTLTFRTAAQHNPVADPYSYFDVMSYCGALPLSWWISTTNYNALYSYITNNFQGPVGGGPPPGPMNDWLLIRGLVNYTSNTVDLLPFLAVSSTNTPPSPPPGNFVLVLYDINGNILDQIPFEPERDTVEAGEDETGSFLIPVLANPAIRRAAIWTGTTLLADLIASANPPYVTSVTVSGTNGGQFTGSGLLDISWFGNDADPNSQLTYTIQYSPDGGATWETIAVDWSGQNYTVDSQFLPAAIQGRIRIIATDGFNSSAPALSSSFPVLNHPPSVIINTPMDGALFIADEQVYLDASANDPQDGPLDGASVQWTSSRDGALGIGDVLNFEATALTEGRHVVTVKATNSLGLTNSASVQIYVLRQPPPSLAIQLAGNQALLSWSSSVTNYILESTTNLLTANWTTVTNTPVAADAQQTVTVDVFTASQFFRLRLQ